MGLPSDPPDSMVEDHNLKDEEDFDRRERLLDKFFKEERDVEVRLIRIRDGLKDIMRKLYPEDIGATREEILEALDEIAAADVIDS